MMLMESTRGRGLPLGGITPRGLQGPGHRPRAAKRGVTGKGNRRHRNAEWEYRGQEGPGQQVEDSKGGKHRDERWSLAGEGNVHVEGLYDPGRVGGNKRVQQSGVKW